MASPSTPMHGKLGAIYRQRPNNFNGSGLNDVTWGNGFSGASSSYFEVEIDAEGTPDTFKWRQDGGAYTTGVSITGAAQTLADGQQITFAATTGHTLGDKWAIGNFKDEATTESGTEAQITDSTKRLLNANSIPTFTDDGGKNMLTIDCIRGKAIFDGNVGNVDVDGNDGFIVEGSMEKVGYLFDWSFDVNVDLAEINRMGQEWKERLPGQANASGSAGKYFIGTSTFFESLEDGTDDTQKYFLLELFNYDPDKDQTGDHFLVWAIINGIGINSSIGDIVKEQVSFTCQGIPNFVENV